MAIKIYFRRLISLLLCCLLVFCSVPVQVNATDPVTAASLAITGGQLAGAGLSGEAALSLAGPVGAVVGLTLGALGVNAYVSQAAQEAGKTRTRFVLDKLVIWGAQAGYTQEQLYSKIAQGISVAADGTIQLGKDAANVIEQFGNWLFATEGEVIPELPTPSQDSATLGDVTLTPVVISTNYSDANWIPATFGDSSYHKYLGFFSSTYSGNYVYCANLTGGIIIISTIPMTLLLGRVGRPTVGYIESSTTINVTSTIGNYYYAGYNCSSTEFNTYNKTFNEYVGSITSSDVLDFGSTEYADDVFVGHESDWTQNKDVLNPSADDTTVTLNPDLINPIIDSLADGQQATMTIIDYLQALQDAWDHALDDVQTAIGTITDSLTGIQEQIAVPQEAVKNPTVTNPSVTPDTTPILNPSEVNPGTAITGLSFDLTNIFPFCIPFDIYAALNLLDAEPVAPSYHFHLEWPYNIVIDFTLDLSPFNQVAAVARTMETLLFIVGLAVMTRSMFIRG